MPRANSANPRPFESISVGELRRLLHADLDQELSLDEALQALQASDRASAEHELDVAAFERYRAQRAQRLGEALAAAAAAADPSKRRGAGDGEAMARRQEARAAAVEEFEEREPGLNFQQWIEAGRPAMHRVGLMQRTLDRVTG